MTPRVEDVLRLALAAMEGIDAYLKGEHGINLGADSSDCVDTDRWYTSMRELREWLARQPVEAAPCAPEPTLGHCQGVLVEGGIVMCKCDHGSDGICGFVAEPAPPAAPERAQPTPPHLLEMPLSEGESEELDAMLAAMMLPTFTQREREIARRAAREGFKVGNRDADRERDCRVQMQDYVRNLASPERAQAPDGGYTQVSAVYGVGYVRTCPNCGAEKGRQAHAVACPYLRGFREGQRRAKEAQMTIVIPRWKCRTCGCLWRDNLDGFVSLFDAAQKSCDVCEKGPTNSATCDIDWLTVAKATPDTPGDATPSNLSD